MLTRLPGANIAAICDTYPASLKRAGNAAPKAKQTADYKSILADKEIKGVIIATPTHLHKEIVLEALKAGKHVYCEAPLAHTVEDARAIATAAKAAPKQIFHAGLQMRSDPQRHFLVQFIRAGAMGRNIMARCQWHKKTSWRFTSPNPDREQELNWRLKKDLSLGLMGEIAIHQLDAAAWFLNAKPTAVTSFGGIINWNDGREVADTVQALFEFPRKVNLMADCTLGNSFDADYEMFYGTDSAVMIRQNKAWMFKEVDSPLLGWEVYARKDQFYNENGIALVANATKQTAIGDKPVEEAPYAQSPLFFALESFLHNVRETSTSVEDFEATFGAAADAKALQEHLAQITKMPYATWKEGYEATIYGIKANEAFVKGQKVTIDKSLLEV
jgi:predicted dehydrogenase